MNKPNQTKTCTYKEQSSGCHKQDYGVVEIGEGNQKLKKQVHYIPYIFVKLKDKTEHCSGTHICVAFQTFLKAYKYIC